MAVINFDSSKVEPASGVADALPTGWYNVMMDESDISPTKNSSPENPSFFLKCRFNVIDGQYQGRKLFARFNIRNSNPQAQEIAYKELSAVCHAVGAVGIVQDSQMLHGRPLKVKVKYNPPDTAQGYDASNDIRAYKNINDTSVGNPPAAPGAAAFPPPPMMAPPPQQAWAPPQGQQPAPYAPPPMQQQYAPPPMQPAPQQPAQAPAWQPPPGGQPWQQPAQQPQQAPAPVQQYAPPQQPPQYAPQPQQAPAPMAAPGNPMAGQPPPWNVPPQQ